MKRVLAIFMLFAVLFLTSCVEQVDEASPNHEANSQPSITPEIDADSQPSTTSTTTRTEEVDFDLDAAYEMIAERDRLIVDISAKESLSRQELEDFILRAREAYGDTTNAKHLFSPASLSPGEFEAFLSSLEGLTLVQIVSRINEFWDTLYENETTFSLKTNLFYPTIFHQDVEIISAKIENVYLKNPPADTSENDLVDSFLRIREGYTGSDPKLRDWYKEYVFKKGTDGTWQFSNFEGQVNFKGDGFSSTYLPLK